MKPVKVIRRGQLRHVERLSMFYRSAQGNTCTRENWVLEFLPLPRLQSNFSNSEAGNHTNLTSVCQFTWAERFAPSPSSTATLNAKLHKEDPMHEYKKSIFEEGRIFSRQQIQNRTERTMRRKKCAASFLVLLSLLCCWFCLPSFCCFLSPTWRGEIKGLNVWSSSACLVAVHASTRSRLSPVAANPLGCSTAEPWVFTDLCPTLHTVPSVSRLLFSPSLLHHLNY